MIMRGKYERNDDTRISLGRGNHHVNSPQVNEAVEWHDQICVWIFYWKIYWNMERLEASKSIRKIFFIKNSDSKSCCLLPGTYHGIGVRESFPFLSPPCSSPGNKQCKHRGYYIAHYKWQVSTFIPSWPHS